MRLHTFYIPSSQIGLLRASAELYLAQFGTSRFHRYLPGKLDNLIMKKLIYDREIWIFFILTIFFVVKVSIIQFIPFLNDEAYALTISREISLSYFDHPPLTMWILYFLSEYTSLQNPVLFRIPFIFYGILLS